MHIQSYLYTHRYIQTCVRACMWGVSACMHEELYIYIDTHTYYKHVCVCVEGGRGRGGESHIFMYLV